jgi:hypothetical protein
LGGGGRAPPDRRYRTDPAGVLVGLVSPGKRVHPHAAANRYVDGGGE